MTKTYKIKEEPITLENGNVLDKQNIYYYEDGIQISKEYYFDGLTIRDGYIDENLTIGALDLNKDILFGISLLRTFLTDNRDLVIAFTPEISLGLLQKFAPIKALAEVGDIKTTKAMLMSTAIDSIFTQERKDKYIQMCNDYLGL